VSQQQRSNQDRNRNRRRKNKKKKNDPSSFWGSTEKLAELDLPPVEISTNPAAVVKSLNRAPLSGQQNAADLYFAGIYERAANLAGVLAAAGDLIETDELS